MKLDTAVFNTVHFGNDLVKQIEYRVMCFVFLDLRF
jgi:hypothetical protein